MSVIVTKLTELATSISGLLANEKVVFSFMFIAMLMGTFAMFKALLGFAFRNHSGFNQKAINVMSFMFSFIGTTGIAFMYSKSPATFIYIFGGGFGYFLILFLVVFVFKIMHYFAEDMKDEKGIFGKGGIWMFFMVLAALLSAYMLLGYTGKIISSGALGCSIDSTGKADCKEDGTFLFGYVYNFINGLIPWLMLAAIIFAIVAWNNRNKDEHGHDSHDSKDPFGHKEHNDQEHAEHVSHLIKEFDHSMHEAANTFQNQSNSLNNLQRILDNGGSGGRRGP